MSESKPAFETTAGLVVVNPSGGRSRVTLDPLPFLIGRQAGNHLVLRDNRISRCHARIVADEGGFFVEDLNSRHGVYVNGAKVTRADSVARFTVASVTPGTFLSARSTRVTQEAQVMPSTPRSRVAGAVVAVSMAASSTLP